MKSAYAYLLAVAAVAAAVLLRLALDPILGDTLPLVTLFGAVAAVAWFGGYRPAIVAAVLGYFACSYFFIPPRGSFGFDTTRNLIGFLAYLFTCAIIVALGEATRHARSRMAETDRRKDEFLALLAHELRNPLAPLRNSLTLLNLRDQTKGPAQEARTIMGRQLDHLVRLVDDLMDVNRINRGALELRRERVDLASALHEVIASYQPMIERAQQHLEVRFPSGPIYLGADPVRLGQIFGNVLGNASKFTPPGGAIVVSAADDGVDVVISIKDSGVGLAPEEREAVFEMFARAKSSLVNQPSGLGVGLSLSRRLAELHGGIVTVRSEGLGKGSEFLIRLPMLQA